MRAVVRMRVHGTDRADRCGSQASGSSGPGERVASRTTTCGTGERMREVKSLEMAKGRLECYDTVFDMIQ